MLVHHGSARLSHMEAVVHHTVNTREGVAELWVCLVELGVRPKNVSIESQFRKEKLKDCNVTSLRVDKKGLYVRLNKTHF